MADEFVIEKFAGKMLLRAVAGVLLLAAVAYPVDFAIWRLRVAMHGGMGSVQVDRVVAAELKGNKEDYYYDGTMMQECSKSLYPQGNDQPCWWLKRHNEVVVRY
jgi:hypothetical protein